MIRKIPLELKKDRKIEKERKPFVIVQHNSSKKGLQGTKWFCLGAKTSRFSNVGWAIKSPTSLSHPGIPSPIISPQIKQFGPDQPNREKVQKGKTKLIK